MQGIYSNQNNLCNQIHKNKTFQSSKISFKGACCDEYVQYAKTYSENNSQPSSFWTKYFSLPCATIPTVAALLGVELKGFSKIIKAKGKAQTKQALNKFFKNSAITALIGTMYTIAASTYFNRNTDKNLDTIKRTFNEINSTNAKFSNKPFSSTYIAAYYQPGTGEINFSSSYVNDPLNKLKSKYLLKHELVHAKQYETIARLDDGIEKINYCVLKSEAENFSKNPLTKRDFDMMYNELKSEFTDKYDNATIIINERKVPLKEYMFTMHKLMNNEIKDYHELPILINAKHYEEVRNKQGKLTPEEEMKANAYFNACLNYKAVSLLDSLNPFSKYYNNLLEKEAYKENPWWTRIL